jgi:iron(III) transport system substrate-binding protein
MRRTAPVLLVAAGLLLAIALLFWRHHAPAVDRRPYVARPSATVTYFPALAGKQRTLVIEAATDVTFMRPFIMQYQKLYPDVAVQYDDGLSTDLIARALDVCRTGRNIPDLYLSVATDHLVRLANDGCGQVVDIDSDVPGWREWRHEVFAFALEPAVFVYNRRLLSDRDAPQSHLALIDALRSKPAFWNARIGTYDIRQSGIGYNYAEFDSRESSIYGRLIESLGRSNVALYCCSNEMVRAVERGTVVLAYNVQLSYAYAAQRSDPNVGIVIPSDFQAVQTRSVVIPAGAENVDLAKGFLNFLESPSAMAIASALLTPPRGNREEQFVPSDRLLNQANVSSSLLRLQDPARHSAFTHEWLQAVHADLKGASPR